MQITGYSKSLVRTKISFVYKPCSLRWIYHQHFWKRKKKKKDNLIHLWCTSFENLYSLGLVKSKTMQRFHFGVRIAFCVIWNLTCSQVHLLLFGWCLPQVWFTTPFWGKLQIVLGKNKMRVISNYQITGGNKPLYLMGIDKEPSMFQWEGLSSRRVYIPILIAFFLDEGLFGLFRTINY